MEGGDVLEEADREAGLLEQMPPPSHPESEKERLASWLRLLRRARVAIRRLHRNLRHPPREALVQMSRAARAPQDFFSAEKTFRYQACDNTGRDLKHKVSPPRPKTFNHEVGADVFEIVDSVGMRISILNAVCMGTTYDQALIARESETLGSPSSHACLRAFGHGGTRWSRGPKLVRCGRGTHSRGVISSTLAKNAVAIRPAALEAQELVGRVERRGATLQKMMLIVFKATHASGRESMDMMLSDCLNAANEMTRHGCFCHSWYFHIFRAVLPRWVAKMNVLMFVLHKHMLMDRLPSAYSHVTERRYVKRWCDETVANELAVLLCERPHPWLDPTKLETLSRIAEKHEQGGHGLQLSDGSRLIGFERDKNSLGETQSRTC